MHLYNISERTALRKHAYLNIQKILPPKNENFQIKKSDIFHISAQNIDCGYSLEPPRRGGSNEYPQSMFLSRNKKNNVYPCKPQFYYKKKSGLRGSKLYRHVFVMDLNLAHSVIRWLSWMRVRLVIRRLQYSFEKIDHKLFSSVILSLPEGQLSVSGERMRTLFILVNRLED